MDLKKTVISIMSVVGAAMSTAFAANLILSRRNASLSYPSAVILGLSLLCYAGMWVTSSIILSKTRGVNFENALQQDGLTYLPALLLLLNIQLAARWLLPLVIICMGILKVSIFRVGPHNPFNSFTWRETLGLSGLFLVLFVNLVSIANITDEDLQFIISHPFESPDKKLRQKMIFFYGENAGAYYDFVGFIDERTPENATILLPPLSTSLRPMGLDLINGPLDDYVLYPRNLIYGSLDAIVEDTTLTHAVLVPGQAEIDSIPSVAAIRISRIDYLAPGLGIITLKQGHTE